MKKSRRFLTKAITMVLVLAIVWTITQEIVFAHCDALDGPVVKEAIVALKNGDVTPVLKWVNKEHMDEIRAAFKKTLVVRSKGPEAKEIADRYFFETLVRLHRAGEGEPFTGLKPAGNIQPSVAAADKAIENGSVDALAKKIGQAAEAAIQERFARLMETKISKDESIEAGQEYVEAYVNYIHFVEKLHETIAHGVTHDKH